MAAVNSLVPRWPDYLQRQHLGRFADGQLRTLQRRVKMWRALEGPARETPSAARRQGFSGTFSGNPALIVVSGTQWNA